MKVLKHFTFITEKCPALIEYIKSESIPVEQVVHITAVDIFDDDPHWPIISDFLKRYELRCMSETIYSKKELFDAEWLTVYSQYRFGYPQPEGNFEYQNITYSSENFCPHCDSGLVQVDSFRMKKAPKWGKRHFMELNWIGDELFVSDTARNILEKANITGIDFCPVKNKNGMEYFEGIHQLVIPNLAKNGFVHERTSIRKITNCPRCGQTKYVTDGIGMLAFRKECFHDAPDVVKSSECFGADHYITRIILVRQKVYRTILENKLERSLVFEPILLL